MEGLDRRTATSVFIEGFELFDGFTAISERSGGWKRLRLLRASGKEEYVKADEPAYSMGLDVNSEPDTPWLRYSYTSMTTPATTYELNMQTGERRQLKQQPVIGYDASQIRHRTRLGDRARRHQDPGVAGLQERASRRTARRRCCNTPTAATVPRPIRASVSTNVSLLDRGMVYAIAHIRGGQEMGRDWYDNGKLLQQEEHLHRFHRRHRLPGRSKAMPRQGSRRGVTAAAPAAC